MLSRTYTLRRCCLPILGAVLLLCMLVACTTTPAGTETDIPTAEATEGETSGVTESVTDPETAPESETTPETEKTGWMQDTGTFNEGKVDYEKLVETEYTEAYPDDKLGEYMGRGDKGVTTYLYSDFSDNDVTVGGKTSPRSEGAVGVADNKLCLPFSADSEDHLASDGWTTWFLNTPPSLSDYKQTEFTVRWDVRSKGDGAWMTAMIGCYVSNAPGKIPDNPGDGLWIAFQENANKLTVYHPDTASWSVGWADIPVAEGLMSGSFRASVVCTPDRTTYVYITPADGSAERLVATVRFEDGKIRVYDEGNTMIQEDNCTTGSLKGENYSIFVHGGGGAAIEEVAVLGASLGKVIEHTSVNATPTEGNTLGLDITNKTGLVSICYSVWFDAILGSGSEKVEYWNNITESLAGNQPWGGTHAFHYWAKPALGYYRSSDKEVIRTHMTQLYTAGVDFIIIDLTNAGDGYIGSSAWSSYIQTPMDAICDTIMEMRAEGKGTPYVVFWVGDGEGPLYQELYDKYHAVEKWQDCFVYWDGKPFMLTTHKQPDEFPLPDLFTTRSMWGLKGKGGYADGQWSFLNIDNTGIVAYDKNGNPEQVSVAMASQETYMSMSTAHGRDGGTFWFKQWYRAFEVQPKIVTLTWWNEWTAQRFDVNGEIHFTDNYNQNYSRDIEPMEGGHGDQYYQWMIQYISAYKGGKDCPILVEERYTPMINRWLKSIAKDD